jgi:hypothetical protein
MCEFPVGPMPHSTINVSSGSDHPSKVGPAPHNRIRDSTDSSGWTMQFVPRCCGSTEFPAQLIQIKPSTDRIEKLTACFGPPREVAMKPLNAKRMLLVVAVLGLGIFGTIDLSQSDGLALSIQSAEARVGRPATPASVAGVARRTTRRAVVGGAAVGAAAAGTACVRVLVNGTYVCR